MGISPLFAAIMNNQVAVAQYLLYHGADINAANSKNVTPLEIAILKKYNEAIHFLLDNGASYDDSIYTHDFIYLFGDMEMAKYLISKGFDVNVADEGEFTPLSIAINMGKLDLVKFLIEQGADVHYVRPIDGENALTDAVMYGFEDIAQYLIDEHGFDVNYKSAYGMTFIEVALNESNFSMAKRLVDNGIHLEKSAAHYFIDPIPSFQFLVANFIEIDFFSSFLESRQTYEKEKIRLVENGFV